MFLEIPGIVLMFAVVEKKPPGESDGKGATGF
jgi:hypothetical protein